MFSATQAPISPSNSDKALNSSRRVKPGRRSGTGTGTGSGSGSGSGTESGGGGGNGGGGGGGNGRRKSTEGGNNNSSSGSASGASGSGSIKKNVKNPKDLNFFESLLFGPPIQEYQSIAAAEMSKVTSTHFFLDFFHISCRF